MTRVSAAPVSLGLWPTPLHRLERLEARLGIGPLLVKRDDLAGFGPAGNKTRTLEYLLADARSRGCDTLVTGGRPDSNFCPAAAAAASVAGLGCELLMVVSPGQPASVNMALSAGFGARLHLVETPIAGLDERIAAHAAAIDEAGGSPYAVPRGGSTAVGALGFARAAGELHDQLAELGLAPAAVVCAVGSGGSYAGLLAGAGGLAAQAGGRWPWPLLGASVSRPLPEMTERVRRIAGQCAELGGLPAPEAARVSLVDALGAGHGRASAAQLELARLARASEGLLLDSTYTAKSLELAVEVARTARGPVVFWHTGGAVGALAALTTGETDG